MQKCTRCKKQKKEEDFIDAKGIERKQCVCDFGGILLSDICYLKNISTELNVFCPCYNIFKMSYLDIGFKGCDICLDSTKTNKQTTNKISRNMKNFDFFIVYKI